MTGVSTPADITPMDAPSRPRVLVDEPYRGPSSYRDTPADRALFAGREAERAELLNLVLSESLVVLTGRSGMGKSSLINARLLADLRDHRFFPVAARVTSATAASPTAAVFEAVHAAADGDRVQITPGEPAPDLWTFFNTTKFTRGDDTVRVILIIDQFEELFTRYRVDSPDRRAFVEDLADLVRRRVPESFRQRAVAELEAIPRDSTVPADQARRTTLLALLYEDAVPDVKVVLAIRDDYLADLLSLRRQIPGIMRNSLRLEPLTLRNAREAILRPTTMTLAEGVSGIQFGDGVVGSILEQLSGVLATASDDLPLIEPLQLQIFCRFLFEHRRSSPTITLTNLKAWGGARTAAQRYYRGVMKKLPRVRLGLNGRGWRPSFENLILVNRPRAAAHRLCEQGLIDFSAHRTALNAPVVRRRFGIRQSDLDVLVRERLIVEDPRPDTVAYELVHDSLVKPLRTARARRRLRTMATSVAVVGAVLVMPEIVSGWWTRRGDFSAVQQVDLNPADRQFRLSRLAASQADLSGLDLSRIRAIGERLTDRRFDSTDFAHASLERSSFDSSTLRRTNFAAALLSRTSFSRADLSRASFDSANATNANFEHADLSGAKFRGADVRGARMDAVTLDDSTDFSGTAWWLASGWSDAQFVSLAKRLPPDAYANSSAFAHEMQDLTTLIEHAPPANADSTFVVTRELALERRARLIATKGQDLNAAFNDVEVAYDNPATHSVPEVLDIRGYVLLRRTWLGDRSVVDRRRGDAYKSARVAVNLDPEADSATLGERVYHLALAFEGMRDTVPAVVQFRRAAALGYTPTYERLFTPSALWRSSMNAAP
ncbi:MAG: pentapeptide repeat-containing protein, partial [Gemmatimonas sp.]